MPADSQSREEILDDLQGLLMRIGRYFATSVVTGLTSTQFMLLKWLDDRGQVPMGELAEALGITMAGATGLVDRLVHSGHLSRERSETDRRLVLVGLTDAGREAVRQAVEERFQRFRELTARLSEEDLADFRRILGNLAAVMTPSHHSAP